MSAALDFKRAADPAQVFLEGVRDAEGKPTRPAPWQEDVIRSEAKNRLILVSRQGGKSTTVGAKCAHGMIYAPGLYLVISPTLRQSKMFLRKTLDVYRNLEGAPRIKSATKTEMELENGSLMVALPGDDDANIRGFSAPRAIIIDEASRVPDSIYAAIRPMRAASPNCQIMALTTPWGRRGWFYEAWESDTGGWEKTRVTAHDCPHITDEFLADELAAKGDWYVRQEFLCEFVDNEESFFSSEMIEAMNDDSFGAWIFE